MKKSTLIWASCLTLVALIAFSLLFQLYSSQKTKGIIDENVNIVSIPTSQPIATKQINDSNKQDKLHNTKANTTYPNILARYALIEDHIKDVLFKDENSKKLVHVRCNATSCKMFVPSSASGDERYMYVSAVFLAMYQGMLDSKLQAAGLKRNESSAVSWEKGSLSASLDYTYNS